MTASLRLMFHSIPPWAPTGYGQQMKQILHMMKELGHTNAMVCYDGLNGGILNHEEVRYYPSLAEPMGEDAVMMHAYDFQPDIVFSFTDIWALNLRAVARFKQMGIQWIPIVPIDYEPVTPDILSRLEHARHTITIAPFGHRELNRCQVPNSLIPHTTPTQIFKPHDRSQAREFLDIPEDVFLFGMVAANGTDPPRKGFQHALDAFARFHRHHPDSALYLHTLYHRQGGFDIQGYIDFLGIQDQVYSMDDYRQMMLVDDEGMASVYSAMDCLLMPSAREGFGVPIIEAMACQVPVIATDFTSMRDLVEDGVTGFKLRLRSQRFTNHGGYIADPCADHLYELMERVYVTDRLAMGQAGRRFVVENYDRDLVRDRHWRPFLQRLARELSQE